MLKQFRKNGSESGIVLATASASNNSDTNAKFNLNSSSSVSTSATPSMSGETATIGEEMSSNSNAEGSGSRSTQSSPYTSSSEDCTGANSGHGSSHDHEVDNGIVIKNGSAKISNGKNRKKKKTKPGYENGIVDSNNSSSAHETAKTRRHSHNTRKRKTSSFHTNIVGADELVSAHDSVYAYSKLEIVRLIGQSLRSLGLDHSALSLEEESGVIVDGLISQQLEGHILEGDWDNAVKDVEELIQSHNHDTKQLIYARYLISREKFVNLLLDCSEAQRSQALFGAATICLREQVEPFGRAYFDKDSFSNEINSLCTLFLSKSKEDIMEKVSTWRQNDNSRDDLLKKVISCLPVSQRMPDDRLLSLFDQVSQLKANTTVLTSENKVRIPLLELGLSDSSGSKHAGLSWRITAEEDLGSESLPTTNVQVLHHHKDEVWLVEFSHSGDWLISGSRDGKICLYSCTGLKSNKLRGDRAKNNREEIKVRGNMRGDATIYQASLQSNESTNSKSSISLLPRSGSTSTSEPQQQKEKSNASLSVGEGPLLYKSCVNIPSSKSIRCLKWSPDDQYVLSAHLDCTVSLWKMDRNAEKETIEEKTKTKIKHNGLVTALAWCSDSKRFLSAGYDKIIRLSSIHGDTLTAWTGSQILDMQLIPQSEATKVIVICASERRPFRIFDLVVPEDEASNNDTTIADLEEDIENNTITDNGQNANHNNSNETNGSNNRVSEKKKLGKYRFVESEESWPYDDAYSSRVSFQSVCKAITCLTVSNDGKTVIGNMVNDDLYEWNLETGKLVRVYRGIVQKQNILRPCLYRNSFLACGSDDATIKIWDRNALHKHVAKNETINGELDFCFDMNSVRVDLNPIHELKGHTSRVNNVAFSPTDPTLLVSCSDDCTIRVWTRGDQCKDFEDFSRATAIQRAQQRRSSAGKKSNRSRLQRLLLLSRSSELSASRSEDEDSFLDLNNNSSDNDNDNDNDSDDDDQDEDDDAASEESNDDAQENPLET
uniref:Uncharacterized protein n=1 Tax=Aplanochytrium stocchinoi TaxID=215587 RepID=A0A7S3V1D7_9STRA|mmetsp:Transcript_28810/g.35387  ORF Transcript_28810/g.35387 Transcript_28810/m.35387 type:complete len:1000 (+) Transcript_28810:545-3544(+)|eukprot:CAMPEP_0204844114 /NCGR_PEP_ID=MMETSP1346-20131115/48376_1 /ASSEMBLY_ACC=CAM_ASM_000771 /TAXON_ID=215587 /ORGANISM="Aplanochytrium stocchinoi, Strain GSBS06" /LENGTH=999 /DNA_ID=CAMNT_0051983375 /DNA_START=467 /DNA_END=3466 /DNA_ORIENTATION=+